MGAVGRHFGKSGVHPVAVAARLPASAALPHITSLDGFSSGVVCWLLLGLGIWFGFSGRQQTGLW